MTPESMHEAHVHICKTLRDGAGGTDNDWYDTASDMLDDFLDHGLVVVRQADLKMATRCEPTRSIRNFAEEDAFARLRQAEAMKKGDA